MGSQTVDTTEQLNNNNLQENPNFLEPDILPPTYASLSMQASTVVVFYRAHFEKFCCSPSV